MPIFIDPTGEPTFGIGICARCSRKFPLSKLHSDPNSPGLMVCEDDLDDLDPYRLPARQTENINLPFVRPDVPLIPVPEAPDAFILAAEDGEFIAAEDGRLIEADGLIVGIPKVELP